MRTRRWFRPALWSTVVGLHAATLLATAWVQWRASSSQPREVRIVVAPPPPPPARQAAPRPRVRTQPRPHAMATPQRVASTRRRVAVAHRSASQPRRTAQRQRPTRHLTSTVLQQADLIAADGTATATTGTPFARPELALTDREAAPLAGCAPPAYPRSARRAGHAGLVLLRVHLDAVGHVAAVILERSCGHRALDRAAREAVLRWRFSPRVRGGATVSCELLQPVSFRLR